MNWPQLLFLWLTSVTRLTRGSWKYALTRGCEASTKRNVTAHNTLHNICSVISCHYISIACCLLCLWVEFMTQTVLVVTETSSSSLYSAAYSFVSVNFFLIWQCKTHTHTHTLFMAAFITHTVKSATPDAGVFLCQIHSLSFHRMENSSISLSFFHTSFQHNVHLPLPSNCLN